MALTAPSKRLTPIAEDTFAKHPQHAHVARHSIIPIMPRQHTLEPCPKLPDGPVQPLPQGLFDLLQLPAEPLGDRLAPHRKLARPRLATDMREAEKVKGFRFPLATSLAPVTCPTPELNEARLVRVQFEVKPVEACPQVAQKLLGVVFVLEADDEIVTVSHEDDLAQCVPAAALGSPEVKDIVQVQVRQEWTCATPLRRPFVLLSPVPILQHARLEPLAKLADDALGPNPVLDKLPQPFVVHRIIKAPNVGIEYPVDVALFNADRDGIQRMVRAASRAGTVREAEELWLVHSIEHLDSRPLDDFVFQRRLANGALVPIGFRYVDTLDRWGLVGSPLQA